MFTRQFFIAAAVAVLAAGVQAQQPKGVTPVPTAKPIVVIKTQPVYLPPVYKSPTYKPPVLYPPVYSKPFPVYRSPYWSPYFPTFPRYWW